MQTVQTVRQALQFVSSLRRTAPDGLRVLIVDDEMPVLSYVNRILSRAGYRPAMAAGATEAVNVAATMDRLDLLVTDLVMPAMSGEELAHSLRRSWPQMKVLYQTGYSDRLFVNRPTLGDGEAFIEKPYTIHGFEEAVSMLVYGTRSFAPRFYAPALWTT